MAKLYLGFGDRGSPVPGGSGDMYFDSIRLYPPSCVPSKRTSAFAELDMDNDCSIGFGDIEIMADEWLERDVNLGQVTAPSDGNLIGWWKLDDGSGSKAIDSSGYDNDGTLEIEDVNVWWVTGRNDVNYALDFDGGRVRVPDVQELRPLDQVSAAAWVKYFETQSSARVVVKGANDKETYSLEVGGNDELVFLVRDGNDPNADNYPDYPAESEGDELDRDEWTHVAGTYDGNSVRAYVNGELVAENNDANAMAYFGHPLSQDPNDLAIGNRSDAADRPFKGIIDDVRVYDYGLSQAEVGWLASDGTGIVSTESIANLIDDGEAPGERSVNMRDFAVLAVEWLKEELWP
ncbi:MAG: LamG domain-containing protein [Planctomycetota bacterium]